MEEDLPAKPERDAPALQKAPAKEGTSEVPSKPERDGPAVQESSANQGKRHWWDWGVPRVAVVLFFAAVAGAWVAWCVLWMLPVEGRMFAALLVVSGYLIFGGLAMLLFIIPAAGSNPEIKTEFYSSRAAYYCVITGLVLAVLVSLGAVLASELGGLHVLGSK